MSDQPGSGHNRSRVTVILATYNRPDTLRVAIRSVIRQTITDWKLLVIGDHCDHRTGEVVSSFEDSRITYHNLPARFGEQAGPNSVGMALANTPYMAFLNHDDAFLPDHLERALSTLEESGAGLFMGRAAVARKSVPDREGKKRPQFTVQNAANRPGHLLFHRSHVFVEPASSWVFRSRVYEAIGPWNSWRDMSRLPAQEWIMRMWRRGIPFVTSRHITVLVIVLRSGYATPTGEGFYKTPSLEHDYLDNMLEAGDSDHVRDLVARDLEGSNEVFGSGRVFGTRNPVLKTLIAITSNRLTAVLFRLTGFDIVEAILPLAGCKKGWRWSETVRIRTGEDHLKIPDFKDLLDRTVGELAQMETNSHA